MTLKDNKDDNGHNNANTRLIEVDSTLQNAVVPTFLEMQGQLENLSSIVMYPANNNPVLAASIDNFVNLFSNIADSLRMIAEALNEIKQHLKLSLSSQVI